MLIKPFLGEMSGKLAGIIFSHNRGGSVAKRFRVPTNPNTTSQQTARNAMSQLVVRWLTVLTTAQRAAWGNYAENVPATNRIGESIKLTAQNHFIRSNTVRLRTGLAIINDAPTTFNLGEFATITIAITSTNTIDVTFDDTEDWTSEDGAAMILQQSKALNQSVLFFKGPFRFYASILGDNALPPTSPEATSVAFPFVNGQRAFVRARITRADGRLSAPQIVTRFAVIP